MKKEKQTQFSKQKNSSGTSRKIKSKQENDSSIFKAKKRKTTPYNK
jgi:hypothetical protein